MARRQSPVERSIQGEDLEYRPAVTVGDGRERALLQSARGGGIGEFLARARYLLELEGVK